MSWQKCPKCNGEGKERTYLYAMSIPFNENICSVCNGAKIIDELTGFPTKIFTPVKLQETLISTVHKICKNIQEIKKNRSIS